VIGSLFTELSWYELWGPIYFIISIALVYWYFKSVFRYYRSKMSSGQTNYFLTAVILLYIVTGSPLAAIGKHYLLSAHMLQLSVLFFIVIPLFILSLPRAFIRKYFWNHRTQFLIRLFGKPWLTAVAFNGLLTLYFVPFVFNFLKSYPILMGLVQILLVINAFLVWWVIISPLPEISRFSYLTRAAYIFFASLLLMPIGFFHLIVQVENYPFYAAVQGDLLPALTAIYDQQAAGGILKVFQLSSYTIALLLIVSRWVKQSDETEGQVVEKNIRYVRGVVIHLDEDKK